MTAITVGSAAAVSAKIPATVRAPKKGLFARLWAAFVEARMRQAQREINLHSHLLPAELRLASERLAERSEKELPFAR
jgi:hypothetical protein